MLLELTSADRVLPVCWPVLTLRGAGADDPVSLELRVRHVVIREVVRRSLPKPHTVMYNRTTMLTTPWLAG